MTPSSAENTNDKPRWGLGIADITPELREQLKAPDDLHGAVIQRVQPGSPSDDAGLQPGQVILGVNRQRTKSASDVQKALASVPKGQDALVLIWAERRQAPSAFCIPPTEPNSVTYCAVLHRAQLAIEVQRGKRCLKHLGLAETERSAEAPHYPYKSDAYIEELL